MDTRHHTVSVRIKSVLDSCDDQAGDDAEMQELEGSQQVNWFFLGARKRGGLGEQIPPLAGHR
jgi:hypothetical protein